MAIARSTRGLIDRALARREALGRAALVEALHDQAARETDQARLAEAIAREKAGAAALDDPLLPATAWRAQAGARLAAAWEARMRATATSDGRREILADTLRTARGFQALMARQDADVARAAARRDPLAELMLLPRRA